MKNLFNIFLSCLIFSSINAQANDTSNQENVSDLRKIIFGKDANQNMTLQLRGKTRNGEACRVEVRSTAFGLSINVLDAKNDIYKFRASRSAKTSWNYKSEIDEGRISASQVFFSIDERSSSATRQTLELVHYELDGSKNNIAAVSITNNENVDWKTVDQGDRQKEIPVFKDENLSAITCVVK